MPNLCKDFRQKNITYSAWCISWRIISPSRQSARHGLIPIRCRNCFTFNWLEPPPPLTNCLPSLYIFSIVKTTPRNSSLQNMCVYINSTQEMKFIKKLRNLTRKRKIQSLIHGKQNGLQRLELLSHHCIYNSIHTLQITIIITISNHLIIIIKNR
jgi:hypothetical protein